MGNVLATVLDRKTGYGSLNGEYAGFRADVVSATDYYPFGMEMPGRSIDKSSYRFGYNTQEKTDEIAGKGNHNTAEFWEYDTRTARRWNMDPKPYIGISDYSVFGGNPIVNIDPNGDRFKEAEGSNGLKKLEMVKAKANKNIQAYRAELANTDVNSERGVYLNALIGQTQGILDGLSAMDKSDIEFYITIGGEKAFWNDKEKRVEIGSVGVGVNGPHDLGAFPHELWHGYQYILGELTGTSGGINDPLYDLSDEYNAAWQSTLIGLDFKTWHNTVQGYSYEKYKETETGLNSGHAAVANRPNPISINTSATVLLGLKDNILTPSASQVLKANPKATVGDAINYYNNFKEKTGSPQRILTGKALEKPE